MRKKVRTIAQISVLAVLGLSTAAFAARHHKRRHPGNLHTAVTAVQIATAREASILSELNLEGTVTPATTQDLTATNTGTVTSIAVTVGQTVNAGQVVATLSSPILDSQLNAAQAAVATAEAKLQAAQAGPSASSVQLANVALQKANIGLTQAQQQYQQIQVAYSQGKATASQVQQAQSAVSLAQLAVTQAQDQLNALSAPPSSGSLAPLYAAITAAQDNLNLVRQEMAQLTITAPFSGTVTAISATPGEHVAAGTPLASLDSGQLQVQSPVIQTVVDLVHVGEAATIHITGHPSLAAKVVFVSPTASPQSLAFTTTIAPNNTPAWLQAGDLASVNVITQSSHGVIIPASALVNINGQDQVFAMKGPHVTLTTVTPSISNGSDTEVTGIAAGTAVVTLGQTYLASGDKVKVTEKATVPGQLIGSSVGGLISNYTPPTPAKSPALVGKKGGA